MGALFWFRGPRTLSSAAREPGCTQLVLPSGQTEVRRIWTFQAPPNHQNAEKIPEEQSLFMLDSAERVGAVWILDQNVGQLSRLRFQKTRTGVACALNVPTRDGGLQTC